MNSRGSGEHHYDLERCKLAYDLKKSGMLYSEVAARLGVKPTRASLMVDRWAQELLLQETIKDLWEYRNS